MEEGIPVLTEEMEKLLNRTLDDLTSTLVNLSGSLKAIECGTHIKIPTDAGYVSFYKSSEHFETMTLYLKEKILPNKPDEVVTLLGEMNRDDEK